MQQARSHILRLYVAITAVLFAWSGINPYDRLTWWLEVAPVLVALPLLAITHKRFPLTPLVYGLIFIWFVLMITGGHYSYANVPAGEWAKEAFGFSRNHYDRVGHFMQGFVPALIARELLLRTSTLTPGKWLIAIIVLGVTGISAIYELAEWVAAESLEEGASSFLGTQGDIWDTQKDMALAMLGAICALTGLSRLHDKQLVRHTTNREDIK